MSETALHARIAELERLLADRDRQIAELRSAIDALLQPAPSELLSANLTHPSRIKHSGK